MAEGRAFQSDENGARYFAEFEDLMACDMLNSLVNIALLVCGIALTWKVSGFLFPSINQVYQPFFLPSFVTNKKANSSGALFICEHRIFGWNLIKYCGSNVTAAGMSIMIHHCIRHGQTVKVLVTCETHVPQTVPDSISSSRFISAAPFVLFTSI